MRRMKLLGACLLLILVSLPFLPGPGWLAIGGTMVILEEEFVWVRRVMNALTGLRAHRGGGRPCRQYDTQPSVDTSFHKAS
jgi:putative transmembrane protein PGPGW